MKNFPLGVMLLAVCVPCLAESTHMHMPEGSKDVHLSLALVNAPDSEGSAQRQTYAVPLISAQFANGVFVNMNTIGIHLSRTANLDYGFQVSPRISRVRTKTADGWDSERKFTPEVGGFLHYGIAHGLAVHSSLRYGGSSDRRGLRLHLGASLWMPVAEHHYVGIETHSSLANRSSLQSNFGVTADQAEPGLPAYEVKSGMRDASISAAWRWHFSNKYTFTTRAAYERLLGSAAASPRIEQAGGVVVVGVLTYRY